MRDIVEQCSVNLKCLKCPDFPCKLGLYKKGYSDGQSDKVDEVNEFYGSR